jgi:hypothetical protein
MHWPSMWNNLLLTYLLVNKFPSMCSYQIYLYLLVWILLDIFHVIVVYLCMRSCYLVWYLCLSLHAYFFSLCLILHTFIVVYLCMRSCYLVWYLCLSLHAYFFSLCLILHTFLYLIVIVYLYFVSTLYIIFCHVAYTVIYVYISSWMQNQTFDSKLIPYSKCQFNLNIFKI